MCSLRQGLSSGTVNFEHVTLTVTFLLLFKNFHISRNLLVLRDRAFIFGIDVPYDKVFLRVPKIFTCDLDIILNIGHNFLTVIDWVSIFGICVPYFQTFTMVP